MAKMRRYQCPGCEGQFDYLHHPNMDADPAPRFCPLCGFDTLAEDAIGLSVAITAPNLQKGAAANVDGIWKAEQEGASHRANLAMEMGLDTTEANNIKISDMKDNLRPGDVTAIEVNNPVSQVMQQNPERYGFQGGAAYGAAYSPAVQSGPYPNRGANVMKELKSRHATAGGTTSDLPALETQQPGYRNRA